MLLIHQTGSLKVGEVVRFTITYTPSADRILPSPHDLHVKIRNTSAIALRAAYLRGPYTLHVASYPESFDPNQKLESIETTGVPEYEPNLRAGASWNASLKVPEDIREDASTFARPDGARDEAASATWIVEITSQVIFSHSAAAHYELLVGRDERSLNSGFAAVGSPPPSEHGNVEDLQDASGEALRRHPTQPKGVYSKAIKLVVEDTQSLWNKPAFPDWEKEEEQGQDANMKGDHGRRSDAGSISHDEPRKNQKRKRIHLVVLTHGLHSNLGADMLYLKESIDKAAKSARAEKQVQQDRKASASKPGSFKGDTNDTSESLDEGEEEDEDVMVRGFSENAMKTEKGIKYLGKRLARYILATTYPDQPFEPITKSTARALTWNITGSSSKNKQQKDEHDTTAMYPEIPPKIEVPYKFTSISFIGHSLGGLVQTYAIAYIQKHSPNFFEEIKPINFITLASPFLGLSNENPLYVKFALDFGLVGRTGQDLGLLWRAPNLARSGWSAVVGGLGTPAHKMKQDVDSGSKPLLRILPKGPAHGVLQKFRNRTLYSNVVNDGIVPLRTSCLLFLDWKGLGRVEKARRENGLVGTVAEWGWAELRGVNANASQSRPQITTTPPIGEDVVEDHADTPMRGERGSVVPQPSEIDPNDSGIPTVSTDPAPSQFLGSQAAEEAGEENIDPNQPKPVKGPWKNFMNMFKAQRSPRRPTSHKDARVYSRSQTLPVKNQLAGTDDSTASSSENASSTDIVSGQEQPPSADNVKRVAYDNLSAPPRTTIFESAGALLNPPLPSTEFLIDPSSRPRTIFHDRIYHPEDIPPPLRRRRTGFSLPLLSPGSGSANNAKSPSTTEGSLNDSGTDGSLNSATGEFSSMKPEEKIARAYHRDLTWRKVLVSLKPDAHNNMIVRRTFANAYGWPVVKHLVDTHFGNTFQAKTEDDVEASIERAKNPSVDVGDDGTEVSNVAKIHHARTESEQVESRDVVADLEELPPSRQSSMNTQPPLNRQDSAVWSDAYFEVTDDDEDEDDELKAPARSSTGYAAQFQQFLSPSPSPTTKQANTRRRSGIAPSDDSGSKVDEPLHQSPS